MILTILPLLLVLGGLLLFHLRRPIDWKPAPDVRLHRCLCCGVRNAVEVDSLAVGCRFVCYACRGELGPDDLRAEMVGFAVQVPTDDTRTRPPAAG